MISTNHRLYYLAISGDDLIGWIMIW